MVREKVGPVAAFKIAIIVKRLPKTRSGKILRGTVRKIADNEPYKMPATIDDPAILDEIKQDLKDNNILKTLTNLINYQFLLPCQLHSDQEHYKQLQDLSYY